MKHTTSTKYAILLIIVLLFLSAFTGCLTKENIPGSSTQDSLIISFADPIFGFHPWINSYDVSTISINHNIFNSLVGFNENYKIIPELAESWSNPNNLTWRFQLKANIYFHNNELLTIDDIKYSIDLILNDNTSVFHDLLFNVKETKIINNHTIDIITQKPCPILLNKLTDIFIIQKKYHQNQSNTTPMGTGAYQYNSYFEPYILNLTRNENYWRSPPHFKDIKILFMHNGKNRTQALLNQEIDIAEHIPLNQYSNISNNPNISISITTPPTVIYLGFDFRKYNSTGFPNTCNPLADIRVRKALAHAINLDEIIQSFDYGTQFIEPASQYITPYIFGYNPNITRLSYDLNQSKSLLTEAGYPNGFNLTLDTPLDFYQHGKMCETIAKQLSEIVNITIRQSSIESFFTRLVQRNTSFYILGWLAATGDGGEIFDYLLRTVNKTSGNGAYNIGYYTNSTIDDIADTITYTMNTEQRQQLMQQGFFIAHNDIACIPLCTFKHINAMQHYIDWTPTNIMIMELEKITLKEV